MHTGTVVMLALVAACAMAFSSERTLMPDASQKQTLTGDGPIDIPQRDNFRKYIVPKFILPYFLGYEESPRMSPSLPDVPKRDWLTKEIDRINRMAVNDFSGPYEPNFPREIEQNPYFERVYVDPKKEDEFNDRDQDYKSDRLDNFFQTVHKTPVKIGAIQNAVSEEKYQNADSKDDKMKFAFTPLDKEYFERNTDDESRYKPKTFTLAHGGKVVAMGDMEPPRQIRQNPNLSKEKTLVIGNLGKIQSGIFSEERKGTSRPDNVNIAETPTLTDPAESIYSVAVIAAVGAALAMAIFGFAIGWYRLSKRAKAAADVDYPAYGVTGPSIDMSGDRKLAHSAHMYHYQHQKQQIIAMEREGLEHRNGSVSDPESEVENEEGDYTVYECPGFATTGNMEVKNPLFSEDPSPLTPGKCQVVKQQPKD